MAGVIIRGRGDDRSARGADAGCKCPDRVMCE